MTALTTEQLRPLMFGIAYRMLGSVSEAEDVVHDALLRMHEHPPRDVSSARSYAATVTTRIAIDELRSARRRRERYVGTWLPEPIVSPDPRVDPQAASELSESASMGLLVLMERLSPTERAVFVLREAFDYDYSTIAGIVDKSEENVRQIMTRARRRIADRTIRFDVDPARQARLAEGFFAAAATGDLEQLERVLAQDVAFFGDGGGKEQAVREPVVGQTQVARFIVGLARQAVRFGARMEPATVNGGIGGRILRSDGSVYGVFSLEFGEDGITAIRNVINPDKLGHIPH